MAMPVMRFIAVKVGGRMLPSCFNFVAGVRRRALVAVLGMVMVVYVAVEVGRTMEPGTGAYKGTASKPFRAVISVRRASIRSGFVISVRAIGSNSDIDVDLSFYRFGRG